jgi:catechol 2,3-dioxygenase-like lactoylglutathione lyase family enzyme
VLGKHDHIAYIARDLDAAVATLSSIFGMEVTREFELPAFSLRSVFLHDGTALVEVFELFTPELAEPRLADFDLQLDHVGYEVPDIEEAAAPLRAVGVRFSGPDGIEVDSPVDLGGSLHLWTMPGSEALGLNLQLIERPT